MKNNELKNHIINAFALIGHRFDEIVVESFKKQIPDEWIQDDFVWTGFNGEYICCQGYYSNDGKFHVVPERY